MSEEGFTSSEDDLDQPILLRLEKAKERKKQRQSVYGLNLHLVQPRTKARKFKTVKHAAQTAKHPSLSLSLNTERSEGRHVAQMEEITEEKLQSVD